MQPSYRDTCDRCGNPSGKPSRHRSLPMFCDPCQGARALERKPFLPCSGCGVMVRAVTRNEVALANRGRAYCSPRCAAECRSRLSSETMAKTNRAHASARMKAHNPMASVEARARMSATLRKIGHRPPLLGGNGRGPTTAEARLAEALGWRTNVIYRVGLGKNQGYPTHYKIDVGNEALHVAIEIDGSSHGSANVRAADRKKTSLLALRGWTVLRFTNADVMERLEWCLSTISASIASTPTSPPGS